MIFCQRNKSICVILVRYVSLMSRIQAVGESENKRWQLEVQVYRFKFHA